MQLNQWIISLVKCQHIDKVLSQVKMELKVISNSFYL